MPFRAKNHRVTVLREFLKNTDAARYGLDLMRATGLKSGTVYPILQKLERAGWVIRQKEDIDPRKAHRPARFYFRLTDEGLKAAKKYVASWDYYVSEIV